jgi:hypothetical protein
MIDAIEARLISGCTEWTTADVQALVDEMRKPLRHEYDPVSLLEAAQWLETLRSLYHREEAYCKRLEAANAAMREVVEFAGYWATARGKHIERWARRLKEVYREYRATTPQETAAGSYMG